jgi:hypothetical protein
MFLQATNVLFATKAAAYDLGLALALMLSAKICENRPGLTLLRS